MLVHVLNFGTNWWARFGNRPDDPNRYGRGAAYFNSTGVRCGSKIRRHWMVSGLIRFNGVGDFNPHMPERSVGQTFVCSDLTFAFGGNRLLFERKAARATQPDRYLITVSSAQYGSMDFNSPVWKSICSSVIASSQLRETQEAMLLMKEGDWIQTSLGFWQLAVPERNPRSAGLELVGEPVAV